jgi:hypothetical protein
MANTYVAIATVTVGSGGASSIDFSSIPSTYTDLVVKLSLRGSSGNNVLMSINSSTSNFSYRMLEGDGATAASYNNTTGRLLYILTTTANTFSNIEVYLPNYAGATNKSYSVDAVSEANATTAFADLTAGLWSNTSAITALGFTITGANFVQYSTATLYGIKNT